MYANLLLLFLTTASFVENEKCCKCPTDYLEWMVVDKCKEHTNRMCSCKSLNSINELCHDHMYLRKEMQKTCNNPRLGISCNINKQNEILYCGEDLKWTNNNLPIGKYEQACILNVIYLRIVFKIDKSFAEYLITTGCRSPRKIVHNTNTNTNRVKRSVDNDDRMLIYTYDEKGCPINFSKEYYNVIISIQYILYIFTVFSGGTIIAIFIITCSDRIKTKISNCRKPMEPANSLEDLKLDLSLNNC